MKKYNLAILGATGAVGQEFIKLLNERDFPFDELRLLASVNSVGKQYEVKGKMYSVQEATKDSFDGIDIALFAGGAISKEFAPIAVKAGAVVIDNSSTFRMVFESIKSAFWKIFRGLIFCGLALMNQVREIFLALWLWLLSWLIKL